MPKFNVNHYVYVKLTDLGRKIHREFWEPYSGGNYKEPDVSIDGWSRFQLHDLMRVFGPHMSVSCHVPFETEIIMETEAPFFMPKEKS